MGLEGSAGRGGKPWGEDPSAITVYINIRVFYINITFHMTFFFSTAAAAAATDLVFTPKCIAVFSYLSFFFFSHSKSWVY